MCCYIRQITICVFIDLSISLWLFCLLFHSWQFTNFVEKNDLGAAAEAARRAVESAKENLKWSEIYGSEIESWLKGKMTAQLTPEMTTGTTPGPTPKPTPEPTQTNQWTSSLSLSPAVCITLFLSCLYQMLTTFKLQ